MTEPPEDARESHANAIKHHRFEQRRFLGETAPDDIVCIMVCRNEALRLPDCLRHHRDLGVNRFVAIENCSDDGTLALLLDQPDVDVVVTQNLFREARSAVYWLERFVLEYGIGRWFLVVDPDEQLVYDGMGQYDLRDLAAKLRQSGQWALPAPLIDMYSALPPAETAYHSGQKMIEVCDLFDGDYFTEVRRGKRVLAGGPRRRVLSKEGKPFRHALMKHPFFRYDKETVWVSRHEMYPVQEEEPVGGALLHFKFLDDFARRTKWAVDIGQHYMGAIEYQAYQKGIDEGAFTSLKYSGSVSYDGPTSLIARNLMPAIAW